MVARVGQIDALNHTNTGDHKGRPYEAKRYVITYLKMIRAVTDSMRDQKADHTDRTASRRRGRQWAFLAVLALCVGQTVGDTHVHIEEHEDEVCTVCAISEPGHDAEVEQAEAQPQWHQPDSPATSSAPLPPRPYADGRPRAPPIS